jgi:hypothetical protein
MLYIEAPAGVGYSICKSVEACGVYNDDKTAEDNLAAVLAWFTKFPEY